MSIGTLSSSSDSTFNLCGIANSHAYSLLSAFTMTDSNGTAHKMVMARNPWGVTYYNWTWSVNDTNWTDALVAQVPLSVDPRTSNATGVFVMPIEGLTTR